MICYVLVFGLIFIQVVFVDIDETVGAATEKEFVEKYGKYNVNSFQADLPDGRKFEGEHKL